MKKSAPGGYFELPIDCFALALLSDATHITNIFENQ